MYSAPLALGPPQTPLQHAGTVPVAWGVLVAAGLAAVHLFAGRLLFLRAIPRSRWLSLAGGVSVAFVFVHLLPEVAARQARVGTSAGTGDVARIVDQEQLLFLVVLVGFATFYGVEQAVQRSRERSGGDVVAGGSTTRTSEGVFWSHVGTFAAYNAVVGYLLVRRPESGPWNLLVFFTAMALHFLVNDVGLRGDHEDAYHDLGRWILAGAVLVGAGGGYLLVVREVAISALVAFLGGGIVLNVVKEELPEECQSRFWAFAAGAGGYSIVLLLV